MEGWRVRPDCGVCHGDFTGSECKRLIENDDPRLSAKELCALGLAEVLIRNRENGRDSNISHAWECIDSALTHSGIELYRGYTNGRLDEAFGTIDKIMRNPNESNVKEMLESLSVKNYEGLIRARVMGQPITPDLIKQTRDSVGTLITTIDEIRDYPKKYDGTISGFMAEEMVLWLSLYSGKPENIIYPTSPRQGHSDMQAFNHDGYILRPEGTINIETKRHHRKLGRVRPHYDRSTTVVVVLQDILDKTRSKCGGRVGSGRTNYLIDYVRGSLKDRESRSKNRVLESASTFLMQHIERNNPLAV